MTRIALIFILTVGSICHAAPDDAWVNDPPMGLQLTKAMPELASSRFVEVPVSLADEAFERLANTPVVELGEHYFPGFNQRCTMPGKAYLVRAVYEHGNTGVFHVKQLGHTLWVLHYALGAAAPRHRSALIVCTATAPTTIYVSAGGAM
jgi:hypothetical protein